MKGFAGASYFSPPLISLGGVYCTVKIFTFDLFFFLIAWQKKLVSVIKYQQNDLQNTLQPCYVTF